MYINSSSPGDNNTVDGGRWLRWSRNGKQLYFVSSHNVLTVVDIREGGDSLEVGHPLPLFPVHPSPALIARV